MTNTTKPLRTGDLAEPDGGAVMNPIEARIEYGCCGCYVSWFQEDETVPLGYRTASWYGTREACEERMKDSPPVLLPARENGPYLHARAE